MNEEKLDKVLAPFLCEGHGTESMRPINVAATRAIGKLIVIANVDYIEQKLRDNQKAILYQWIQYLKTQRHVYLSSTSELIFSMEKITRVPTITGSVAGSGV